MSVESFTENGAPAKEPTDAEYEKLLFENLTSEESDDELEEAKPKKKKSRYQMQTSISSSLIIHRTKMGSSFDPSTMLADADEVVNSKLEDVTMFLLCSLLICLMSLVEVLQ